MTPHRLWNKAQILSHDLLGSLSPGPCYSIWPTSTHSLMAPAPRWVSICHLEPTHMFSFQALTYTVFSFSNFPEHMFSPSNLIFYLKTLEHPNHGKLSSSWTMGHIFNKKKKSTHTSCHLLDYCFVLSLTSCLVILSSKCVHMSHFPNHSEKSLRVKIFLMFLQTCPHHSGWHHAIPTAWRSVCWSAMEAALNALVRTEGNVKLPPDEVSKGVESWRDINNNNSIF